MKCYFADFTDPSSVVTFAIPELGYEFKAYVKRDTPQEAAYVSLLSLLEFREQYPSLFGKEVMEVFSDNPLLVSQVTGNVFCGDDILPYLKMVAQYRAKFPFMVNFIPKEKNPIRSNHLQEPLTLNSNKQRRLNMKWWLRIIFTVVNISIWSLLSSVICKIFKLNIPFLYVLAIAAVIAITDRFYKLVTEDKLVNKVERIIQDWKQRKKANMECR